VDDGRLDHVPDLGTCLKTPSLPNVDERIAYAALRHRFLENRLRAALPRLTRTGAVGGVAKRDPLLVDRRQPPAGDLRTVETGGEDHVERVLRRHPFTAQLLISTQAAE
jgi:hypothetical protein